MTSYCTLADAKIEAKASNTTDDAKLRRFVLQISRRIDSVMGSPRRPFFAPYTEQRRFQITGGRVDSFNNTFYLGYPLLSMTAVTRNGETITSTVEKYAFGNQVADMLRITNFASSWYDAGTGTDTPPNLVLVTGIWGWHEDYDHAYDAVDSVENAAGIDADDTSITVNDDDGVDLDGFTPRFSPGILIKIDSELMDVTAASSNTLTVKRAVNGTTAAAHAKEAAISTYKVDERIRRIVARQAALLYARIGAFQVETLDGVGAITYPQDLLVELRNTLVDFQYA